MQHNWLSERRKLCDVVPCPQHVLLLACAIVAPVEWRRIKVKCSKELAADLVLEVLNLVAHAKAAAARCKRGIRVEQHALGVPALAGFPAALA
eukprot:364557-Chlamydomonas_euryale.AAC.33